MKKLLIYTLIGLTSMAATGQVAGFAQNTGSATGSGLIIAEQILWRKTYEPKSSVALDTVLSRYGKRMQYYLPSVVGFAIVDTKIQELRLRALTLRVTNGTSSFYFPYKRLRNDTALEVIITAIDKLDAKVNVLPYTHWGELVNLKQNLEMSLEVLARRLDAIESKIKRSATLSLTISTLK